MFNALLNYRKKKTPVIWLHPAPLMPDPYLFLFFRTMARKWQLLGHGAKRKLPFSGREYRKIVYWLRPRKKKPSYHIFDCLGFASAINMLRHSLISWPSAVYTIFITFSNKVKYPAILHFFYVLHGFSTLKYTLILTKFTSD